MKTYKHYYIVKATPEELFKALTLPYTIQLWSGASAIMSTDINSEFSLWDGAICGRNLEFDEGRKIVQEWYFGEDSDQSIVTIKLHAHPKGTSVELVHTNIPDEAFDDISQGWDEMYFGALIDFYEDE
ncbi:MAG: SRPBCC domain-containing protein [Bacteroidia bacterium]|nr:SRPBCC domain-containing protein [Bacteroidia bacterium]